jgi:hypothetical protein
MAIRRMVYRATSVGGPPRVPFNLSSQEYPRQRPASGLVGVMGELAVWVKRECGTGGKVWFWLCGPHGYLISVGTGFSGEFNCG